MSVWLYYNVPSSHRDTFDHISSPYPPHHRQTAQLPASPDKLSPLSPGYLLMNTRQARPVPAANPHGHHLPDPCSVFALLIENIISPLLVAPILGGCAVGCAVSHISGHSEENFVSATRVDNRST